MSLDKDSILYVRGRSKSKKTEELAETLSIEIEKTRKRKQCLEMKQHQQMIQNLEWQKRQDM